MNLLPCKASITSLTFLLYSTSSKNKLLSSYFLPLNVTFPGSVITFQGLGLLISTKLYNFIVLLVLNTNLHFGCHETLHLSTVNFHMIVLENHMFILLWCFHHPFYTNFIPFLLSICSMQVPFVWYLTKILVLGLIFVDKLLWPCEWFPKFWWWSKSCQFRLFLSF